MLQNLVTGKGKNALPQCPCGCRATNHIHASIAHRIAPTGVVHHQGKVDRFWKMHRLDTKWPHSEGHWMSDMEILYTFCCYDEAPACEGGPRLPLPRTLRWETFMYPKERDEAADVLTNDVTIDVGSEDRLVRFPINLGHGACANACRYDDGVVLAMRVKGVVRTYPFRVVGTAPAVGVFVCTARRAIPELEVREEEPLFAAAANIVVVGKGANWPGPPWTPTPEKVTYEQIGWFVSPIAVPGPYPKTGVVPLVCVNEREHV